MLQREISYADRVASTQEGRCRLWTEQAIASVTKQIEDLMESQNVSRSDLAIMLNRTKGWVTQLLDGDRNKTIRTVAYVFAVLGAQFEPRYAFPATFPGSIGDHDRLVFNIDLSQNVWFDQKQKSWSPALAIKGMPRGIDPKALEKIADG